MKKSNTVAIIQCTTDDLYIGNNNPDDYCISVLKKSKLFNEIIIASPKTGNYKIFNELTKSWGIKCYFGSNFNIAERIYKAAEKYNADIVVRVLLKRFYIDLDLVNEMIEHIHNGYDYVKLSSDINYETAADVMSYTALKQTVSDLSNKENSFQTSVYKFSPWRYIETNNEYKIKELSYVKHWDKAKIRNVKFKLNKLFSSNENQQGIEINNPSSRYKYILKYINSSDNVLDIACGKSGGTKLIAKKANKVFGIDYNKEYIKNGLKNIPANVSLFHGSDELLTKFNGFFDKIVSLHTLEHVSDDSLFLSRIYKSLKKGGILIMEVPRLMPIPLGEPLWPFHEREYSHYTMMKLFNYTGFSVEISMGGNRGEYVEIENAREVLFYVCKKK